MSLCLTHAELAELAGRKRRSAIIRWLQASRIPYVLDADRWPKVLRTAILDQGELKPHPAPEPQLDFS